MAGAGPDEIAARDSAGAMIAPTPIPHELEADVLALNNAHAEELSLLDAKKLASRLAAAFYACRIGSVDGLLLAFDESAAYDSPNYLWFRDRYSRFVYVDRVVVAPVMRRRGLARLLYADVFRQATDAGHDVVVCEVNLDPPNPGSDAFHAALGFTEVGRATIADGRKTVRYLRCAIASGPAFRPIDVRPRPPRR